MAFQNVPRKEYKLRSGQLGTEWEMLNERVQALEKQKQAVEDEIEILRHQMNVADGAPHG